MEGNHQNSITAEDHAQPIYPNFWILSKHVYGVEVLTRGLTSTCTRPCGSNKMLQKHESTQQGAKDNSGLRDW